MDNIQLVESIRPAYEQLRLAITMNDLICVTGQPVVGKTTLTRLAFEQNKHNLAAFVSCLNITTPVQLYTKLCSKFHAGMNICKKDKAGKYIGSYRVGQVVNEPDFPQYCEEYCKYAKQVGFDKLFIVIDQVELARGTQLLESIAMLMTIASIRIVVITNKSPTNIIDYINHVSPRIGLIVQDRMMPIFVPNWSKQDIIEGILEYPPRSEVNLYKKFVQNVVNILYIDSTRNFREIKSYCQENYPEFLRYYETNLRESIIPNYDSDNDDDDDNNFDIHSLVNQRQITHLTSSFLHSLKLIIKRKDMSSWQADEIETKLTYNAAFLVIAAYVAAHTSPSDDKRNFSTHSRTKSRRGGGANTNFASSSHAFTLERLLHIYEALVLSNIGEKGKLAFMNYNDTILSDLERFENLGIIQVAAGDGFSSDTRYKLSTCIRLDGVEKIAEKYEFTREFKSALGLG